MSNSLGTNRNSTPRSKRDHLPTIHTSTRRQSMLLDSRISNGLHLSIGNREMGEEEKIRDTKNCKMKIENYERAIVIRELIQQYKDLKSDILFRLKQIRTHESIGDVVLIRLDKDENSDLVYSVLIEDIVKRELQEVTEIEADIQALEAEFEEL